LQASGGVNQVGKSSFTVVFIQIKIEQKVLPSTPLLAVYTKQEHAHRQVCGDACLTASLSLHGMQVRNLRERLEEEHQALLQREQDKAILEVRIARLTRIILHSTRIAKPGQAYGQRYRQLLLRESQAGPWSSNTFIKQASSGK
jgi:hypothetical protein